MGTLTLTDIDVCNLMLVFLYLMTLWMTPIYAKVNHVGSDYPRCDSIARNYIFQFVVVDNLISESLNIFGSRLVWLQ